MKQWIALNKIEFLLTKRQLVYYLLSVGMPTAFYLFFSGMYQDTPGGPREFYARLPHLHDGFFNDVDSYLFISSCFTYRQSIKQLAENITS